MKQNTVIFLLFFLLLSFGSRAEKRPNIVWITSEDNSKHYMKLFDEHGVATPQIESLAENGLVFDRAFSNAAVCSAARSTLISSCYGPRLASHYHRNIEKVTMPDGVYMFPKYLHDSGYYTTNNAKEDYNIIKMDGVWDDSSKKGSWRNRKEGQPFFHVFNIATTHESRLHFTEQQMNSTKTKVDPEKCFVQPNHPNTELYKYTNAYYRDKIVQMDGEVGAVVDQLKKDGLYDDTFIFYFGDHGGVLPGSKGYINEMGVHVPLVVHVPANYKHLVNNAEGRTNRFVSFVDFGATVLNLAGVDIPKQFDGKPFLGEGIDVMDADACQVTYSYADRFDEKYEMVRAVRKGKIKYVRNYQNYLFDGLMNNYRYKQLAYNEWKSLFLSHELNNVQSAFFKPKSAELLFDVEADPFEMKNLATDPNYSKVLHEMRSELNHFECTAPDISFYPEYHLIQNAFDNVDSFGKKHKGDLKKYRKVADLALEDFEDVKTKIEKALSSSDFVNRYWALNVCLGFGEKASELNTLIHEIYNNDSDLINRVLASSFLCSIKEKDKGNNVVELLYKSEQPAEALLILNSIVYLRDSGFADRIEIEKQRLNVSVRDNKLVKERLSYLNKEFLSVK